MDEKLLLTYNRASLKMVRNNLHVYAMETTEPGAKTAYHESMMKIDEILENIDKKLNQM
ncbi:hypothetical protein BACCIP111883_01237 [Sutcliffiella rhizosphaerae]|uniref:Uncharacterized protein n=1 Tax=Sutcliffiella rhizosphaerae TaxID=2880967 RepID=A0ABN8A5T1_9BACI|nr:hypothetical protein BACCIP111883_01237 [Sutcliffiella rhizosphaerae]